MPEEDAVAVRKPPPPEERPNIWKTDGNTKLTEGDYKGALQSYTRGIDAAAEVGLEGYVLSQLFSNRAQAHAKLSNFDMAVEDCEAAIRNDRTNAKAYWRGANAAMKLGSLAVSVDLCTRGIDAVGDSLGLQTMLDEAKARMATAEAAAAQAGASGESGNAEAEEDSPGVQDLATPAAARQGKERPVTDLQQVIPTQELADRGATLLERYKRTEESDRDEDDVVRARRIFEKVLIQERKNETALIGLGEILNEGLGCNKDTARANQLWMIAVNAGSVKAQIKVALQGLNSWALTLRAQALDNRGESARSVELPKPPPRRWRPGDKL
mmetsp:Transcript_66045/g.153415  ORF Transcript_66045/g.153415 Transcript_66045/m.153415 type:complete len:326 (+) Transcript_66045:54-1031(+)